MRRSASTCPPPRGERAGGRSQYIPAAVRTFAFGAYPTQLQSALSNNYTWVDTVSWTRGAHQLRFGGEIDRVAMRRSLPIADNGLIFFVSGATGPSARISRAFCRARRYWVKVAAAWATTTTAFPATPGLRRMTIGSARRLL
jgi:hypothetical protein